MIFNPLDNLESTSSQQSLSSLTNTEVGRCPKCKDQMTTASIANADTVFYCPRCRVAAPRPDEL